GKELELTIIDKKGNKVKVRVDDIKEAFGLAENEQIKFLTEQIAGLGKLITNLLTQQRETDQKLDTIQKQQNETDQKLDTIQKQQNEDRKENKTFQKEIIVELKEVKEDIKEIKVKQDKMEKDINNIVDKNNLKR
ncbi:MAG: hypothetical protein LBB39_01325, partial [Mycoplasmataceae bacterium]|nr:hypothetical protein [Mycoplasmataceae bacterium]